jgi:hypothetical protein
MGLNPLGEGFGSRCADRRAIARNAIVTAPVRAPTKKPRRNIHMAPIALASKENALAGRELPR